MSKIDVVTSHGSPYGVTPPEIYSQGVGGAELSLLTWFELMKAAGHQVRIFNNPRISYDGFYNVNQFRPDEDRDALIAFRGPIQGLANAKGKHIFWSTDQYTNGDYNRDVMPWIDEVVVISPRHQAYFEEHYSRKKTTCIDLCVRVQDYLPFGEVEKEPGLCLFCSVPDRGLEQLRAIWPEIVRKVSNAKLVITSDYRLWGAGDPGVMRHRLDWLDMPNVSYVGAIPRGQLAKLQLQAMLQTYPCTYDELFCISAAECQYAGAVPITSSVGALETTNRAGVIIEGTPGSLDFNQAFVKWAVTMLTDPETYEKQRALCVETARTDFGPELFRLRWEEVICG